MSGPNIEEVNTSPTGDAIHNLDGNDVGDVNSAATSLSNPITSKEVAGQIGAATDRLTKQLEKLCDFMSERRRDTSRRDEETSAPIQGPSRPRGERFDTNFSLLFRCISIFFKDFHKIRRDFVVCFQNFGRQKIEVLQVFGCSLINFTSDTQPYNFVAHLNTD